MVNYFNTNFPSSNIVDRELSRGGFMAKREKRELSEAALQMIADRFKVPAARIVRLRGKHLSNPALRAGMIPDVAWDQMHVHVKDALACGSIHVEADVVAIRP